jgi:proteic killer suppression protein
MEINYKNNKLEKQCTKLSKAQKELGKPIALKLFQRINELKASSTLKDVEKIRSARLHELSGKRKGQYAVNLTGNYRLIFVADDSNIKLEKIKIVKIEEIVDYH